MCDHDPRPAVACSVRVRSCDALGDAGANVFRIALERTPVVREGQAGRRDTPDGAIAPACVPAPMAGQFFMLRANPSGVLLGRPISVYAHDDSTISFLVLRKGRGTAELCALQAGSLVDLVGPVGNSFPEPGSLFPESGPIPRIAIIGGGIGVAPVAGFSRNLKRGSFDFYASFRSTPYGLEGIAERANRLEITTEDGSAGVRGMLPAVFEASEYDLVYACGPTAMLRYVKDATVSVPRVFLSLEQRMACGAGACLGCTVRTVSGNRRCCVDGPVFDAKEVLL